MGIDPDVVVEAARLIEAAEAEGCTVRVMGGVAISMHATAGVHPALRRTYGDIDLVSAKKDGRRTLKMLAAAGYEPNERFNAMNGGRRLVVYDMQNGRQLDVFVGEFAMCHRLPIADRLQADPTTLPLAELLLTKLQVVHTNRKDVLDICAILLDHEIGDTDDNVVNAPYVASLLAGDWGLWRTSRGTIETTRDQLPAIDLAPAERDVIDRRLTELWDRVERQPKSLRWRSRAKIGERTRWYEEPEEIGHRTLDAAEE
jgi:Uncharacterised nucleotidyltransferase